MLTLAGPVAAQDSELALQLQRIRRDLSDLQAFVYSGKAPQREGGETAALPPSGGSDSVSRLQVQVQNIETQIRDLTGRIEEIEFGVSSIKDRVEKLIADVDVRLQALESGGAGAQPSGTAPTSGSQSRTRGGENLGVAAGGGQPITGVGAAPSREGLQPGQEVLGTMSPSGAKIVKPPLKSVPEAPSVAGQPGSQVAALAPSGPREQYNQAFGLLQQREYGKAAMAFDAFVEDNPESPLASNALYWLGETHYFQKDYAEAARVFLDGYKRYPKGNKAPDSLLKLGKSLAAINEKKPACAALKKLVKSFPKANKRLLSNARSELSRLGCS
ncbi:MAG: tol-pal system protein YbgF [Alphaproteobacteria bacterium]|nr:tol-pal system protein YbgF [Alphaproteobacteria bacterium]